MYPDARLAGSGVAFKEAQFAANSTNAANSNGQTLVMLDEATIALDPSRPGQAATVIPPGANWTFNKESIAVEKATNKDLADLKGRIQSELARRGEDERRKSVDVDEESRSRASKVEGKSKSPAKQDAGRDDETIRFDENRNNSLLNDRLRKVQSDYRQLGTGGGAGTSFPGQQVQQEFSESLGGFRQGQGRGDVGGDGSNDGFVDVTASSSVSLYGAIDPASAGSATRVGLMGVDVPLPTDGLVYWFVGARAGSSLTLDASPTSSPWWRQILVFLASSAALGFGVARLAKRSSTAGP